jgi:transposase InsO family protein
MPWKAVNEMSLKRDFVELANQPGANMSELCRRFGVSRPTGYELLNRWREEGESGLEPRSRKPHGSPLQTKHEVEREVLRIRDENPVWGGRKIRASLRNKGHVEVPSASTITAILRRHGKLERVERTGGKAFKRFERSEPNDLWQMDFKGHFGLSRGGRCHPLTVLDDHSRYNIVLRSCGNERDATVREHLLEAFERYGLPGQILCDNAPPWGVPDRSAYYTSLGVWLLELGVEVIHGKPYHPQTQGKEERFHRTLKAEVLSRRTQWSDLVECEKKFSSWRIKYNYERPHESLGDVAPGMRYRPSTRPLPSEIADEESHYLAGGELRRVKSKGEITFRNRFFGIGQPFVGKTVALRPRGEDLFEVYYCWKSLGLADLRLPAKPKFRYEPLIRPVKDVSERV